MRLPRKLSGLVGAGMMAAGLTAAATPADASTPDVPGARNSGGVPMQTYRCNGTIAQSYFITQFQ